MPLAYSRYHWVCSYSFVAYTSFLIPSWKIFSEANGRGSNRRARWSLVVLDAIVEYEGWIVEDAGEKYDGENQWKRKPFFLPRLEYQSVIMFKTSGFWIVCGIIEFGLNWWHSCGKEKLDSRHCYSLLRLRGMKCLGTNCNSYLMRYMQLMKSGESCASIYIRVLSHWLLGATTQNIEPL